MVTYQRWTKVLFEVHPDADAQDVISVAAAEWRDKKEAIQDATVAEAREYARTL